MDSMQAALNKVIEGVPRLLLRDVVAKKLHSVGISADPDLVERIADHALNGNTEPILWDDKSNIDLKVTLSFSGMDFADAEKRIERLLASMPTTIETTSTKIAKDLLRALKRRWSEEYSLQVSEQTGFRRRLERRWGRVRINMHAATFSLGTNRSMI
ncbi:MAG TPA: hypothetical protein VGG99_17210 [Acetobacteraceae bacterium]|jgi:hypothetical protein